jgi:MYXO-CTERM domain-containing protein
MVRSLIIAGVAGAAASAQAGILSFASDFSDESWTFGGGTHGGHFAIHDGTPHTDLMELLIDDDNGPLDPLSFDVDFNFHAHMSHVSSTPIHGGMYLHTYDIDGDAGWYTSSGPVVEMTFDGAVMTVIGEALGWGSSGSIFGDGTFSGITYTSYVDAPSHGIYAGESVGLDDFAFTLTAINTSGVIPYDHDPAFRGVALDPGTMLPAHDFFAEGSYSGSAQFVPAPGALAVLGLAGAGVGRRRRG